MKRIFSILLITFLFISFALAQQKTDVTNAHAGRMLRGKHKFSLQWISWDHFGMANVTNRSGVYYLKGEQKGRGKSTDFVKLTV